MTRQRRPRHLIVSASLALTLALCALPIGAQDFFDIVDVPLVDIDVVVTDRRDRPVTDLELEDFRLLVDGQEQEIAFFSGPGDIPPAGEEEQDPACLVILFDNNGVEAQRRNKVIAELRQFVEQGLDPDLQVMVVSAGLSSVEIHQELTGDQDLVDEALARIAETATRDRHVADYESLLLEIQRLTGVRDPTLRQLRTRAMTLIGQIQAFSDQARQEAEVIGGHLWQLVEALAGLPGRKAILLVGGAMSINPGEALFSALREALTRTADSGGHQVAADLPATISTGGGDAVKALSLAASVEQVALYAIVVGGAPQTVSLGGSASSMTTRDSSATDSSTTWAPGVDFGSRQEIETALNALAGATGGFVHSGGRSLPRAWDRLQGDLIGGYSLGFQPESGADGKPHKIAVEVEGKRLRVRHRQTFMAQDWDQETAARARSALHFGMTENPLGVELEARPARPTEEGVLRVPLTIEIPLSSLALEPIDRTHRGQMSIFMIFGGGRFQTERARKTILPVILPNNELQSSTGRVAEYRLDQEVPVGTTQIGVGVRDDLSSELSTLTIDLSTDAASRVPADGAEESSHEPRALNEAVLRLPTAALVMSGQSGGSIGLVVEGQLETGPGELWHVPVETQVTLPEGTDPATLDFFTFAVSDDRRVLAKASQVVRSETMQSEGDGVEVHLVHDLLELPAGRYMIRVAVRDRRGPAFGVTGMEVEIPGPGASEARWSSLPTSTSPIDEPLDAVVAVPREGESEISRPVVSAGYRQALEALAAQDEVGARQALRAMESGLTDPRSRQTLVDLAKVESRVLTDLADGSWSRLLPIAVLYGDMIGDYRRSRHESLSEHAVSMSTSLAERIARKAKGPELKREAADLLVSLSGYLLYIQRLRKTQDMLAMALEEDPRNSWALMATSATLEQRGDYPGALETLEKLLRVDPESGEGRLRLGVNLARTHRGEKAVESFRAVSNAKSEDWVEQVTAQELARALVGQGDVAAAIEILEQAVARWPEQPSLRIQLAWILDRDQKSDLAGEWVAGLAVDAARATDSARYRYLQWYEDGLSDLRHHLMEIAADRAAELIPDLGQSAAETAGR